MSMHRTTLRKPKKFLNKNKTETPLFRAAGRKGEVVRGSSLFYAGNKSQVFECRLDIKKAGKRVQYVGKTFYDRKVDEMHYEFKKLVKFKDMPYERPDTEALIQEFEKQTQEFRAAKDAAAQVAIFDRCDCLSVDFFTRYELAMIRESIDSTDPFYEAEVEFFNAELPRVEMARTNFEKALLSSPFRAELEKELGTQLFAAAEARAKTISPEVLDDMAEENQLSQKYSKLIASAQIPFEGEMYTLAQLAPKTMVADRAKRKAATEAREGFFAEHEEELDTIYDQLVKVRDRIAKKLGFKTFTELAYLRLGRTDYDAKMVAGYREQVKRDLVPLVNDLSDRQRRRLGLGADEFFFYDSVLDFLSGNPKPQGSPEEIIQRAKEMYAELSPETKSFFEMMCEYELMDVLSTKGKHGGGYMTMISGYGVPFLFANFNGTQHDVEVMTHEAGHCFQGYMSRDLRCSEYFSPTLEACEIHSMSMEFLTWPWMGRFFGEELEKFKFAHLSGALMFIPYGVTVDAYQHFVYEHPEASPAERKAAWREIEKEFTPWKNYRGFDHLERGAFWQRQGHIFTSPFYYIDYTLAQVCALQYWIRSEKNREEAWTSYLELCRKGGSESFVKLVRGAGLRLPFEDGCVREVCEACRRELDQIDDSKF